MGFAFYQLFMGNRYEDVLFLCLEVFKITPIDIIAMIIFLWYFVKYVAFISIGYTAVFVLLVSLASRLAVHFR
jgi:hypothetical protein